MKTKLASFLEQPWFWITTVGVGLLALLALMPGTPEAGAASGSASPEPSSEEKMQTDLRRMREWAVKSQGDFDKVSPEAQGYINHITMGHGREWIRQEAERLKKEKATKAGNDKGR